MVFGGARRDEEKAAPRSASFRFAPPATAGTRKRNARALEPLQHPHQAGRNHPRLSDQQLDRTRHLAIHPLPKAFPSCPSIAAERPVVQRGGQWIMVDDERFPFAEGERAEMRRVRFRTLGCWPLTAAIESDADTLEAVIAETFNARSSERQGRLIDSDVPGSMEKKKQEGYF
jgi:sulfate adenylyltransferase subunit 2